MNRIENIISLLKANTGKPVNNADVAKYAAFNEAVTLETISAMIMVESPLKPALEMMPLEEVVDQMFMSVFGYTEAQLDAIKATEAGQAGFQYWVNELKNNGDVVNVNTLAIALLNGAAEADVERAEANVAAEYESYLNYDPEVPTEAPTDEPEIDGDVFELTSGTDKLVGTDKNDEFIADLAQNPFAGGVSNTLSSADKLDGGAGTDTLHAEIVPEFFGATGDRQIDIQPKTTSIEIVTFEAREFGSNDKSDLSTKKVSVDAKNMYGVEKIGSKFSDGDLVIENLTTLKSDGKTIRNTSDMTITMDHTDDTDSDGDASDLTVLFDEDYLVKGQQTADATLTIRLINAVQNEAGNNPVEGFSTITFKVGTTEVVVDITSVANDDTQDFTTAYDAIVDLINAELTAQGLTSVSASISTTENAIFSIPVAGFKTGDSAGQYYPITLTNSGSEELSGVEIESSKLSYDTDMNGSFAKTAPVIENVPVSVNIELEKVGRDGEGGNLIVGAKGLDTKDVKDTDVDQTDGINQFKITVKGDESKPSNLGVIQSTNDHLDTVKISSETRTDNSYAALTVRGLKTPVTDVFNTDDSRPFGGTLKLLDADKFKGDLRIGEVTAAANIDKFTAMGGGDIYLNQEIFAGDDINAVDGAGNPVKFKSLDKNEFTIDTGAGDDEIIVKVTDGAQLDVNTGAGADKITVDINGEDDSGSDLTFATIISFDGNDEVTVKSTDSKHSADIFTGAGNDTIRGNSVNITVEAGAGNDVIYAENTGKMASVVYSKGDFTTAIAGGLKLAAMNQVQFFNGKEITITVAMPEETTTGATEAVAFTNGYEIVFDFKSAKELATEFEFYNAIAAQINGDEVINKLVKATVNSQGNLTISYLVDGSTVNGEQLVAIAVSDDNIAVANVTPALLAAVKEDQKDSSITAADVVAAYNQNVTTVTAVTVGDTPASVSFDISSFTDGNDLTLVIDGQTITFTDVGGAAAETEFLGDTFTALGTTFTVSSTGANNFTITSAAAGIDLTTATLTDGLIAAPISGTITDGVVGTNGTDSTSSANNVVNGGLGDDVIVLSSNDAAKDTVVFDAGSIGNDTIVHFEFGATGDLLDFSAWLNTTYSASGSTASTVSSTVVLTNGNTLGNTSVTGATSTGVQTGGNQVNVINFNDVANSGSFNDATDHFADLINASDLTAILNNHFTGGTNMDTHATKHIILIQNTSDTVNIGNLGEYAVIEAYTSNTSADFTSAKLVGTIDFGETQSFHLDNFNFLA